MTAKVTSHSSGKNKPLVSIIMPVYNGEEYLRPAIDSVLAQTYQNFELIAMNDGSKDSSLEIIKSYSDPRIRLVSQTNRGLVKTLNRAIGLAKGSYIARHDADDISRPDRLALQVKYLQAHSNVILLGSSYNIVREDESLIGQFLPFTDDTTIRQDFLLRNPFGHGTIMFRASILKKTGLYADLSYTEDYEYWWRFAQAGEISNLPDPLYNWRVISSSMSHSRKADSNWKLINNLRRTIWQNTDTKIFTAPDVKQRALHYRQQGGEGAYLQFINLQIALVIALEAQNRNSESKQLLKSVLLVHPTAIRRYIQAKRSRSIADYDLRYFFETDLTQTK